MSADVTSRRSALLARVDLFRSSSLALTGLTISGFLIVVALLAPVLAPFDPLDVGVGPRLEPPSLSHLMGTDDFGRDVLSRVIYATRTDLSIGVAAVSLGAAVGTTLGAIAGYFRVFDEILMRVLDVVQAFPMFILAMGLAVALGRGKMTVVYAVGFVMVPIFARLARSEMLSAKQRGYAEAARCLGASKTEMILVHLLPNCLTALMVQFAITIGYAILESAALSFIGLGVRPPEPAWGSMVHQAMGFVVSGQWWLWLFPSAMLSVAILGFNLLADGLRDVTDPTLRT